MSAVSEALGALSDAFGELGVAWYVFGAQALIAHGVPRATADIDVTVVVEPRDARALLDALERAGFVLRVEEELEAWVARTFVLPVWHTSAGLPADVVLALSELEARFARRAPTLDLGVRVPVLGVGDLIVSKILASRPLDLEDVRMLAPLDHDRDEVVALLAEIEAALDLHGLVETYTALS